MQLSKKFQYKFTHEVYYTVKIKSGKFKGLSIPIRATSWRVARLNLYGILLVPTIKYVNPYIDKLCIESVSVQNLPSRDTGCKLIQIG